MRVYYALVAPLILFITLEMTSTANAGINGPRSAFVEKPLSLTRPDTGAPVIYPIKPAAGHSERKTTNKPASDERESSRETIIFDATADPILVVPEYVKEGAAIYIQYLNVNPWAVESNPVFQNINRDYSTGLSELQGQLGIMTQSKDTGKVSKAQNAAEKKFIEEYEKHGDIINKTFKEIEQKIMVVNGILELDSVLKVNMANPMLTNKEQISANILNHAQQYGLDSINKLTSFVKENVKEIYKGASTVNNEVSYLERFLEDTRKGISEKQRKDYTEKLAGFKKTADDLVKIYTPNSKIGASASALQANITMVLSLPFSLQPKKIGAARGDYFEFSDELKDKKGNLIVKIDPPFRIKTYGGTRVDFSVGIGVNIWGNGADYQFRKNPTDAQTGPDTAKVILAENKSNKALKFSPIIGIHWYKTTRHAVQTMLTIGVSPDFSTLAESRLSVGGGLGFTSSTDLLRRIVINGGISVGYADKLKSEYQNWESYNRFANVDIANMTTKVPQVGAFIAVTFNVGSLSSSK
ncbi:hypothetical protein [Chitinophaga qingshengii]|uniref:Outer membrane protein beta-barrel domain-containing protein n=1 Tax=Chitinophaga qingshengii TaxID=1569794 RepID=A0ABR7TIE1_9BACT|nr:hypothetical protein [Chitinophaga qingshengii]MBC9930277.1 hypothetical protein [Chitinophaga qingshengii]